MNVAVRGFVCARVLILMCVCAGADQGGSKRGSGGDDRSGDRDLIFVGLEKAGFMSR